MNAALKQVNNEVLVQVYIKKIHFFLEIFRYSGEVRAGGRGGGWVGKEKETSDLFQDYTHRYSYYLYALDSFDMAVPLPT